MRRLIYLILILLWAAGAQAAAEAPPLYYLIAGGEEHYEVERAVALTRLAVQKGVMWQVLARENQIEKPYRLKAGMVLKIDSTHIVPHELGHGLVINLPELKLYHFHQGAYQRRYSLAVGRPSWPTPTGDYYILNKTKNPTWTVPASIKAAMAARGRQMVDSVPPGPGNPLGAYWLGTAAPGVGIHATNSPWSIGHYVSHGCIRMLPEEIADLFPQVEVGTPVKIIYQPLKLGMTYSGRIYLEAHPNIYGKKLDPQAWLETMAKSHELQNRIDWEKALQVLKAREGVAREITLEVKKMDLWSTAAEETSSLSPRRLSFRASLHEKKSKITW